MTSFLDKKSVRIVAFVLALVLLAVGSLGLCIVKYAIADRWYRPDTDSFEDTVACEEYVMDAIFYIAKNLDWLPESQWDTLGSYAGDAFSYIITGPSGVLTNTLTQHSVYVGEFTTVPGFVDVSYPGEYTIEGYVNLPVGMYDGCYREYLIFDTLYAFRYWAAVLTLLFLLLAAGMLTVSLVSVVRAGKRGELRRLTRIPFDGLFTVAVVFCFGLVLLLQDAYRELSVYLTSSFGYVIFDKLQTGIVLFSGGCGFAVLATVFAAQCSARSLREHLLVTVISRKISAFWLVAGAVCIHFGLFLVCWINGFYGTWLVALGVFDLLLVILLVRFLVEAGAVRRGAEKLAAGELSHKIETKRLHSIWWSLGGDLNKIGEGMASAVEEQMRSERMKTELITNVSHDLKTPLTSIINYVHFLKDETIDAETKAGYLEILDRQSAKLKKLTEDVVEASKAASGVLQVHMETLNAGELLEQSVGEYAARMRAAGLEPVVMVPEKAVQLSADSDLLGRILENLMTNIVKYAQPGTRVYFDLESRDGNVAITAKNISRAPLNISAEELMERFVRGDSSRHSEGSGLGLSIAQSLAELMEGSLHILLDGDLFKAELIFKEI